MRVSISVSSGIGVLTELCREVADSEEELRSDLSWPGLDFTMNSELMGAGVEERKGEGIDPFDTLNSFLLKRGRCVDCWY